MRWTTTVAALGAVLACAAFIYDTRAPAESIGTVKSCFSHTEASSDCVRDAVRDLLATRGARDLMNEAAAALSPGQCHKVGHVVGSHVQAGTYEAAALACGTACDFACIHGAVAQSIADVSGMDGETDSAIVEAKGRALCIEGQSCHGVGHALAQLFSAQAEALGTCDVVSPDSEKAWSCYSGVFMDRFVRASTRANDDRDSLLSPCDSIHEKYRGACYHFLYLNQDARFVGDGVLDQSERFNQRVAACQSIARGQERAMCFEGVGMSLFVSASAGNEEALSSCSVLEEVYAPCAAGYSHALTIFERGDEAVRFCARIEMSAAQQACYESVFWAAQEWSLYSLELLCADDGVCNRFRASYSGNRPYFFD